jgi:hypothetical protein
VVPKGEVVSIVLETRTVEFEPNWRGIPFSVTYAFLDDEPSPAELLAVIDDHGLDDRLRVIAPDLLGWSAVFNPLFFDAVCRSGGIGADIALQRRVELSRPDVTHDELVLSWMQSVVFLAAVTLSAAIIQRRYSPGTIASKYDRLWQTGVVAEGGDRSHGALTRLGDLRLHERVRALAADTELDDISRLLQIRRLFEEIVAVLSKDVPSTVVAMSPAPLPAVLGNRFAFVDKLRAEVAGLEALVVYGSSVASEEFADYDLVMVVDDAERALRGLAGASPTWCGKELNIGVYDRDELFMMQLLSGDNLSTYGICLYGDLEVPLRQEQPLLERNFSFGMVRLRQQIGMLGSVVANPYPQVGDDRRNLYDYFVKVPTNVARGTFGVIGRHLDKPAVLEWMADRCGFDTADARAQVAAGEPALALARSAVGSMNVLRELNREFNVIRRPASAHEEA